MSANASKNQSSPATVKAKSVTMLDDGSKSFTHKDGRIVEVNADGNISKQVETDGTILEINSNTSGDIKWLQRQTMPDGTIIEKYENGDVVQTAKDGSKITKHVEGVTHYDASSGDTRHKYIVGFPFPFPFLLIYVYIFFHQYFEVQLSDSILVDSMD